MSENLIWGEIVERGANGNYAVRFPGEPEGVTHEVPACLGQVWTPQTWLPIDKRDPQKMHIIAQGSSMRRIPYRPTALLRWLYDGASMSRSYSVPGDGPVGESVSWDTAWAAFAPAVNAGYVDSVLASDSTLIVTQYDGAAAAPARWRVRAVRIADGAEDWMVTGRAMINGATNQTVLIGWDDVHQDVFCIQNGVEVWSEHQTTYQFRSFVLNSSGTRYVALGTTSGGDVRITCRATEDNAEVWTRNWTDRRIPLYDTPHGRGSALILWPDGDGIEHILFQSNFPQSESKSTIQTSYPAEPVDPYTIVQTTVSETESTQRARVTSLAISDGSTEYDVSVTIEGEGDVLSEEAPTQADPYSGVHLVYGTGSTFYTFSPPGGYCTGGSTTWVRYDWGFSEFVPTSSHIDSTSASPWMLVNGYIYTLITRTSATHYQQRIGADGSLTSSGGGANVGRSQHLLALDPATGAIVHRCVLWGESDMPPTPAPSGHYAFGGTDLRGRLYCGSANSIAMGRRDGSVCKITQYNADLTAMVFSTRSARYSDDQMLLVDGNGTVYVLIFSPAAGAGAGDEFALGRITPDTSDVFSLAAPATGGASTTPGSALLTGDGRVYVVAGTDRILHRIK